MPDLKAGLDADMTQVKYSIGGRASPNMSLWTLNTIAQANDVVIDHYPIVPIPVRSRCCQQSHASLAEINSIWCRIVLN